MTTLLTKKEVAVILRCSTRKVERLGLPKVKIGRSTLYHRHDVQRFIKSAKDKAAPNSPSRSGRAGASKSRSTLMSIAEALATQPAAERSK